MYLIIMTHFEEQEKHHDGVKILQKLQTTVPESSIFNYPQMYCHVQGSRSMTRGWSLGLMRSWQNMVNCSQLTLKVLVATVDAQWEGMGM